MVPFNDKRCIIRNVYLLIAPYGWSSTYSAAPLMMIEVFLTSRGPIFFHEPKWPKWHFSLKIKPKQWVESFSISTKLFKSNRVKNKGHENVPNKFSSCEVCKKILLTGSIEKSNKKQKKRNGSVFHFLITWLLLTKPYRHPLIWSRLLSQPRWDYQKCHFKHFRFERLFRGLRIFGPMYFWLLSSTNSSSRELHCTAH